MKRLFALCCCLGCLTAKAAVTQTPISSLPQITVPSTNTYFEVADMSATPKSRKLAISDLKSAVSSGVSNITATNITVVTNSVTVLKGGHVIISNSITILTNGALVLSNLPAPSVLVLGTNRNVTSATLSGLTLGNDNTLTATGGGGGGASTWQPNTALAYSGGTNVTMDASGGTNFTVTVTNTTFMADPSNPPGSASTNTSWLVAFKMDASGGYAITWTNKFKMPGGTVPTIYTNANAVTLLSITTSPFTAGEYWVGYPILDIK